MNRPTPGELETRTAPMSRVKVERRSSLAGMTVSGYAHVFGERADLGSFTETIDPAAFAGPLSKRQQVVLNLQHDSVGQVLATTGANTLRLSTDQRGLKFEADLPDTHLGQHAAEMARRGDFPGMSFAFKVAPSGESWDQSGERPHRIVRAVHTLRDVSMVTWPAYPGTVVSGGGVGRARPSSKAEDRLRRMHELERMIGQKYRHDHLSMLYDR